MERTPSSHVYSKGFFMNVKFFFAALITCLACLPLGAQNKLNVIATTSDLAAIAGEVGGDHISIDSIAKGYQDPHFVEAKPSFILKLQKADILILVGRELEIGWLPPLIQQSRNSKIQVGAEGDLDASLQARILGWTRTTERSSRGRSSTNSCIFGRLTALISSRA